MRLKVNGEFREYSQDETRDLDALIQTQNVPARGIAVALNNRVVPRAQWCETQLHACSTTTCTPTMRCCPMPSGCRPTSLGSQSLRGYLSGSIDVVLRVRGGGPRYVVVDYKTNRLGGRDSR